jgi:hypothetical protein
VLLLSSELLLCSECTILFSAIYSSSTSTNSVLNSSTSSFEIKDLTKNVDKSSLSLLPADCDTLHNFDEKLSVANKERGRNGKGIK